MATATECVGTGRELAGLVQHGSVRVLALRMLGMWRRGQGQERLAFCERVAAVRGTAVALAADEELLGLLLARGA